MKSTKNLVSIVALIVTLFTVSFTSVYAVAQAQKVPTKKELKTLLIIRLQKNLRSTSESLCTTGKKPPA